MRRSIYFGFALVILFTCMCMYACQPTSNQKHLLTDGANSLDTLMLSQALADIHRYHEHVRKYDSLLDTLRHLPFSDTIPLRGFTVHAVDLLESLGIPVADTAKATYKSVRLYFGLNSDNKFKLFLTPVNASGNDVVLTTKKGKSNSDILNASESYVMDFNLPCPNTCDPGSPLYSQQ